MRQGRETDNYFGLIANYFECNVDLARGPTRDLVTNHRQLLSGPGMGKDMIAVIPGNQSPQRSELVKADRPYAFIASTPPMISESSVVIWLWRARL